MNMPHVWLSTFTIPVLSTRKDRTGDMGCPGSWIRKVVICGSVYYWYVQPFRQNRRRPSNVVNMLPIFRQRH